MFIFQQIILPREHQSVFEKVLEGPSQSLNLNLFWKVSSTAQLTYN